MRIAWENSLFFLALTSYNLRVDIGKGVLVTKKWIHRQGRTRVLLRPCLPRVGAGRREEDRAGAPLPVHAVCLLLHAAAYVLEQREVGCPDCTPRIGKNPSSLLYNVHRHVHPAPARAHAVLIVREGACRVRVHKCVYPAHALPAPLSTHSVPARHAKTGRVAGPRPAAVSSGAQRTTRPGASFASFSSYLLFVD